MRILALDHGTVRIGAAVSDELGMLAHPLEYIPAVPFTGFLERLRQLIREREIVLLLVGMPRNMDGTYGAAAEKVREFVHVLKEAVTVPVRTWDERLTTVQAHRLLAEAGKSAKQRKSKVDSMAAVVLLQGYLDAQAAVLPEVP
ncbi:MAG: Holliday junction resolvase RuvX [Limisphaerales bacterium]